MGKVFHLQRFSVHDGPGIRTTVFLKGCNLRCAWCHNPESYMKNSQIQFFSEKCVECHRCEEVCPVGIKVRKPIRTGAEKCICCGKCESVCMHDAIRLAGKDMTVGEVMDIVRKDIAYYRNSGGGMTISGGEPLLQVDFTEALLKSARENGIHTALDTAFHVPYSSIEKIMPYTDLILLDIKSIDDEIHKQYTGVSNHQILKNAKKAFKSGQEIYIRIPLIKGVNDQFENAEMIFNFIKGHSNIKQVKILPYHALGIDKGNSISLPMTQFMPPEEATIRKWEQLFERSEEK